LFHQKRAGLDYDAWVAQDMGLDINQAKALASISQEERVKATA